MSPRWLSAHHESVVICDVRYELHGPPAIAAYERGHIPGALYVDLDVDLADPSDGLRGHHPLPSPERFATSLGALGIGEGDVVVAYDASGGATAGRLVVMLRAIGMQSALLDGGLRNWPHRLETGPPKRREVVRRRPVAWPPSLLVSADEVATRGAGTVLLDVRGAARFSAPDEKDRPGGHIPKAKNLPWDELLDARTGRFLTREQLRARFSACGITKESEVIASCSSGVSACTPLVLLEHAGFQPGRLFVPSFSGWSADRSRPLEH